MKTQSFELILSLWLIAPGIAGDLIASAPVKRSGLTILAIVPETLPESKKAAVLRQRLFRGDADCF